MEKNQIQPMNNGEGEDGTSRADTRAFFSRLLADLETVDNLAKLGQLLREFCDKVWQWDAFVFSVRQGRGSRHFKSLLLIDTIGGKKIECTRELSFQKGSSPISDRVIAGEPVLLNRKTRVESPSTSAFGNTEKLSASLIFTPVILDNRVLAILSVQSYTPDKFGDSDRDQLVQLADVAAPVLLRCLRAEYLKEFLAFGKSLNQVVDTYGVANTLAYTAANLLGWDFFSLHLYDQSESVLILKLGIRRSELSSEFFPRAGSSITEPFGRIQDVLAGDTAIVIPPTLSLYDQEQMLPFGGALPLLSSVIMAPIVSGDKVLGLLCLQSETPEAYAAEEIQIITELAEYCGGALERTRTQQILKENSEHYRLLVENINDGIVISQDERFVFFNHRFATMLEYDADELLGKTYKDIYTQEGLDILYARGAAREAGEVVPDNYETLFATKNGRTVSVEANVTIIQDYKGQPATFAVVRDVSERKQAEAMLLRSEQHFRALFDAMTDLIMVVDSDGNYISHGVGGQRHLTVPLEELSTSTVYDALPPDRAEVFIKNIRRSLENQETVKTEGSIVSPSGEILWYDTSFSPLSENTVLLVSREITGSRKAADDLFRSNARYKALLDGSEDYIFVLDRDLRFTHVNSMIEKRFGTKPEERIGQTVFEIHEGRELPPYVQIIQNVFETAEPATYDDDAIINGTTICTETVVSPVFSRSGEVEAVLGISRDVTSRRRSALALQKSEERYAVAVRGANDGIWDWDVTRNLMYLSPRWWAIIGESEESGTGEYLPDVWFDRVHAEDVVTLREKIHDHFEERSPHLENEHRIKHADGQYRWVLCRGLCVRDPEGEVIQMAGSISDVTARKDAEEKLQYGARHDALTGLPNRSYFLYSLEKAMARARRRGPNPAQFAVLFLDLDRFKVVNDSLGHLAGDELIIATARRLEKCVRPEDIVARMGGDEFTVLLENLVHSSDVTRVAVRIIEELHKPLQMSSWPVQVTVSVGIAFDKPEYHLPTDLLRDSDTAMYRAKEKGRNRYQVFDEQMHNSVMGQLKSESDLRQAVARQEFVLHYQPVYHLDTGRLSGFESLIRWNHPENGLVFPEEFVPLAEETGLIVPMGWGIIDEATRACAGWNKNRAADDHLYVSINISPKQFSQPNVRKHILFLINHSGCRPEDVILEITETLLMDDSMAVSDLLQELRASGIRLALDDFGTGYSSLSFLRRSPLDMIKIDQSFVRDLGNAGKSREIIKAILALAKGLGLNVTAEGVETQEQHDELLEMQCDLGQGYLFHRAAPLENTEKIIKTDSAMSQKTTG